MKIIKERQTSPGDPLSRSNPGSRRRRSQPQLRRFPSGKKRRLCHYTCAAGVFRCLRSFEPKHFRHPQARRHANAEKSRFISPPRAADGWNLSLRPSRMTRLTVFIHVNHRNSRPPSSLLTSENGTRDHVMMLQITCWKRVFH